MGKHIIEHQAGMSSPFHRISLIDAVATLIADMAIGIEASRLLTRKSAWLIDNVPFLPHLK